MAKLKRITPPSDDPVTLAQARDHLHIEHELDDAKLLDFIPAATAHAEEVELRRALVTQTWELYLDAFPENAIEIPRPPLQSVTSVKYLDTAGALQTLAVTTDYLVDLYELPGLVLPAVGKSWPATQAVPNAVTVRFVAGYGDPDDVPVHLRQGLLLLIGHWYENREAFGTEELFEVPEGIRRIFAPYRVHTL